MTYNELYNSVPSSYELLADQLSDFFKVYITYDDSTKSFTISDCTTIILTLSSFDCNVGTLTVKEYFDTNSDLTLPKCYYTCCPIDGTPHEELPDSRLIEVIGAFVCHDLFEVESYGNGGWKFGC